MKANSTLSSPRENLRRISRLSSRESRHSRQSTRRRSELHGATQASSPRLDHHHGDHYVTFTATFAVAFKRNDAEQAMFTELVRRNEMGFGHKCAEGKKSLSMEAPKPRHYFHTEFNLLSEGPKSEADVVTYGVACKLFREGETKLIRTFDDKKSDKSWFVYQTHHQIKVTDATLESIYRNTVKVKLWEGKEKCIPRARFERPKAFRIQDTNPHGDDHHDNDFRLITNDQDYPNSIPQREVNPGFAPALGRVVNSPVFEQRLNNNQLNRTAKSPISQLGIEHANIKSELARVSTSMAKRRNFDTSVSRETLSAGGGGGKSGRPNSATKLPHIQCELDLSVLFAGFKHVTSRGKLNQAAVNLGSGVRDMFVTFSIDRELLTEKQKMKLNPLVFRVMSVSNLPSTPMTKKQLAEKCKPVYCSYKFCDEKHDTHNKAHTNRKLTNFDDVKVFLIGTMDVNRVIEEFQVKPFEFELHDRDQKGGDFLLGNSSQANKPALFGADPEDEWFGRSEAGKPGSAKSRNSSRASEMNIHAHGVGRLDMKPLLDGSCTRLTEVIPILPSSTKSSAGIPCGHYLQAGTELKVEICIAVPLQKQVAQRKISVHEARPYQFVCFIITHETPESCQFIEDIKSYICAHNSEHFDCNDPATIMTTYEDDDKSSLLKSNHWFSGFHLYDKKTHAICVESNVKNMQKFTEEFVPRIYQSGLEERLCNVLFDSSLCFSTRSYGHNPILYTVKLHKPVSQVLMNPKMYIEENKALIQGILAFCNLQTCRTLREAIRTSSLPDKNQLLDLQKTMGVPIYSLSELFAHIKANTLSSSPNELDSPEKIETKTGRNRCWTPLDHENRPFLRAKSEIKPVSRVVETNRKTVSNMNEIVKQHNKKKLTSDRPYSEIFEEVVMRKFMKLKANIKKEENKSKLNEIYERENHEDLIEVKELMEKNENWVELLQDYLEKSSVQYTKGKRPQFRPFGHKTALESNQHVKKPSDDRIQELHKSWIENTLHTAKLEPTLPERDQILDDKNMKLYFGKMEVFDPDTPVSIFVGGDKQTAEINRVRERSQRIWKEKLKGDPRWKFYRQNSGTEQKFKLGPQFTMEKLKGILKDEPLLNNLKRYPAHDIPALPVFDK